MIAGSALTAGMFGVGLAPAGADTEERPEVNPEFDEFLVVDEETPIYDSSSEEFGEIIG